MKKVLLIISLIFLVGCAAAPQVSEAPASDTADMTAMLAEKENAIAVLEYQVGDLNDQLDVLQQENEALLAASEGMVGGGDQPSGFMCENEIGNVRYDTPVGTIAIVEGWFATQEFVQSMEGTYSTQFWTGVNSRIHTIRYTSSVDGLSTTANFLIMFEEAGWQPGIMYLDNSCWLDFPY